MKTNFEKVIDFNNCFGSYVSNSLNIELFKTDPKLVDLKYSLINEEVHELFDAFNNKDVTEIVDALSDIKYVLYGMAAAFGINMDIEYRDYLSLYVSTIELTNASNFDLIKEHYKFPNKITDYNDNCNIEYFNTNNVSFITIIETINNDLKVNIEYSNIVNLRINLCKLLYYVNKMGCFIGINLDESFKIVHDSNMTKVCNNEQLAKDTVNWYLDNDDRYKSPSYRKNEYGYVVYNKDTGKILKSIHYVPADFELLLT